jgi:hypothetical protein
MYAFFVGGVFGMPLGCYLREKGFSDRFVRAYRELQPRKEEDELKSETDEFYKAVKLGRADPKDFERYIYGRSYKGMTHDDRDDFEDKVRSEVNHFQDSIKDSLKK